MIIKPKPSAIDYMFHFWGRAFLLALDGDGLHARELNRWQRLLGYSILSDTYMNAIREAKKWKSLPEVSS
jgi:hypothetical protein